MRIGRRLFSHQNILTRVLYWIAASEPVSLPTVGIGDGWHIVPSFNAIPIQGKTPDIVKSPERQLMLHANSMVGAVGS